MAPATNNETAARRRIRRTRTRSAATSGAGGHDGPLGHPATSSACTSAALECPFTTAWAVTSRSPSVAVGRSASARSRRTCRSAPVSISSVDSWRWCRKVGGRPRRPRCSWTTSALAPGQAKKPASRWVSSGTSAPPATTPDAPASTAARVASRASSPSISSWACATGRVPGLPARPRRGEALAAERAPDAAGGDGHDQREDGQEHHGDDHGDGEPGRPGGVVGALEGGLLPGGAEDPSEAVDHELDAQQQRDGRQHQRRRPEIAAQPAVEQPGGDEAARQPRVVEALHAREPGTVVARRRVDRRVGVRSHDAGADQHGAGPGAGLAGEVDRGADGHAARSRAVARARGRVRPAPARRRRASRGGRRRSRGASVSSAWRRSAPAGGASCGQPGATRRPQSTTVPGPCQSSSRRAMSRQAARELSVGSAGRSRSPMTSTLRPRGTRITWASAVGGSRGLPHVDVAPHATTIVTPPGGRLPPQIGEFRSPGRGRPPQ